MTQRQARNILRTKYPQAEIFRPNSKCGLCNKGKIAVVFEPQGKVYSYMAQNYSEVLERLGCIEKN